MAPSGREPVRRRHAVGVYVESMLAGAIALAVTFVGFIAVGLLVAGF